MPDTAQSHSTVTQHSLTAQPHSTVSQSHSTVSQHSLTVSHHSHSTVTQHSHSTMLKLPHPEIDRGQPRKVARVLGESRDKCDRLWSGLAELDVVVKEPGDPADNIGSQAPISTQISTGAKEMTSHGACAA